MCEDAFEAAVRFYDRGLQWVFRHQFVTLMSTIVLIFVTGYLYVVIPKGFFPEQDTGFIFAQAEARQDISFAAMADLQNRLSAIVQKDPDVSGVVGFVGSTGGNSSENTARMFIQLKPFGERAASAQQIIQRLRPKVAEVPGVKFFMQAGQDINVGGRLSKTEFQYTLTSTDSEELNHWAPIIEQAMAKLPGLQDVTSDQQIASPHLAIEIDRDSASRLGLSLAQIDQTLYDAFGQRQVATIYASSTQYKVVLEVLPSFQADPAALSRIYVTGANGAQVPISTVAKFSNKIAPLTINHQGQFPAVTISFNLAPGTALGEAVQRIQQVQAELKTPITLDGSFQGTAQAFQSSLSSTPLLIAAAILAVYIVLGMLYESYIHPITILSALPSAGVGALLMLMLFHYDLSVIALIGIILLIGIVKKNAIMMIDFALEAEREQGKSPLRGDPRSLPAALSPDHDDDLRRDGRRPALGDRPGRRLRAAPAARHRDRRRPPRVAMADALHDAGHLPLSRSLPALARRQAPPSDRRYSGRRAARAADGSSRHPRRRLGLPCPAVTSRTTISSRTRPSATTPVVATAWSRSPYWPGSWSPASCWSIACRRCRRSRIA